MDRWFDHTTHAAADAARSGETADHATVAVGTPEDWVHYLRSQIRGRGHRWPLPETYCELLDLAREIEREPARRQRTRHQRRNWRVA